MCLRAQRASGLDLSVLPQQPPQALAPPRNSSRSRVNYARENKAIILLMPLVKPFIQDPAPFHGIYEIEGAQRSRFIGVSRFQNQVSPACAVPTVIRAFCVYTASGEAVSVRDLWTPHYQIQRRILPRAAAEAVQPRRQKQVKEFNSLSHCITPLTIRQNPGTPWPALRWRRQLAPHLGGQ